MGTNKYKGLFTRKKILRKKTKPATLMLYDKNYFSFTQG